MNLSESLEQISKELLALNVEFAVAGGLAASLYRDQPRLTDDVDLAVAFSVPVVKLEAILTKLELSPTRVSEAQLKGGPKHLVKGKLSPIAILVGRAKDKIGIDLLLPNLSWVETALKRAKSHLTNFGFGPLPTLTAEDVLLAKFHSLTCNSQRFKDLDDIQSIFRAQNSLDLAYLTGQMTILKIPAPLQIEELPDAVRQASRAITKKPSVKI